MDHDSLSVRGCDERYICLQTDQADEMSRIQSPPKEVPMCLVEDHSRGALKSPPAMLMPPPAAPHHEWSGWSLLAASLQTDNTQCTVIPWEQM